MKFNWDTKISDKNNFEENIEIWYCNTRDYEIRNKLKELIKLVFQEDEVQAFKYSFLLSDYLNIDMINLMIDDKILNNLEKTINLLSEENKIKYLELLNYLILDEKSKNTRDTNFINFENTYEIIKEFNLSKRKKEKIIDFINLNKEENKKVIDVESIFDINITEENFEFYMNNKILKDNVINDIVYNNKYNNKINKDNVINLFDVILSSGISYSQLHSVFKKTSIKNAISGLSDNDKIKLINLNTFKNLNDLFFSFIKIDNLEEKIDIIKNNNLLDYKIRGVSLLKKLSISNPEFLSELIISQKDKIEDIKYLLNELPFSYFETYIKKEDYVDIEKYINTEKIMENLKKEEFVSDFKIRNYLLNLPIFIELTKVSQKKLNDYLNKEKNYDIYGDLSNSELNKLIDKNIIDKKIFNEKKIAKHLIKDINNFVRLDKEMLKDVNFCIELFKVNKKVINCLDDEIISDINFIKELGISLDKREIKVTNLPNKILKFLGNYKKIDSYENLFQIEIEKQLIKKNINKEIEDKVSKVNKI